MKHPVPLMILVLLTSVALASPAVAKGAPPDGRTYFILVVGLGDDAYAPEADCLTFGATQACTLSGDPCLDWQRLEGQTQSGKEVAFGLSTMLEEDGVVIALAGQGRVDSRGPKSSISFAGHAAAEGMQINFSFAGRQVGRTRCQQQVEAFRGQSASP